MKITDAIMKKIKLAVSGSGNLPVNKRILNYKQYLMTKGRTFNELVVTVLVYIEDNKLEYDPNHGKSANIDTFITTICVDNALKREANSENIITKRELSMCVLEEKKEDGYTPIHRLIEGDPILDPEEEMIAEELCHLIIDCIGKDWLEYLLGLRNRQSLADKYNMGLSTFHRILNYKVGLLHYWVRFKGYSINEYGAAMWYFTDKKDIFFTNNING